MPSEFAAARGGAARLEELYIAHAPSATRLAYLLTGDQNLAEDLTQDAFVKLAGRFRDLRNPDAFQAYLRRTVINLATSHWRRLRTERAYVDKQGGTAPADTNYLPDVEGRDELWRALRKLPPRQRAAIVLRYYGDLSEQQTADALQVSVGAVKSLVSRGMDRLREHMEVAKAPPGGTAGADRETRAL